MKAVAPPDSAIGPAFAPARSLTRIFGRYQWRKMHRDHAVGRNNSGRARHAKRASRGGTAATGGVAFENAAGQAALVSISRTLESDDPLIAIRRGFIASGISRISSIFNMPLSNAAPLTWT